MKIYEEYGLEPSDFFGDLRENTECDNQFAKDMHEDLENETDRFIAEAIKNA